MIVLQFINRFCSRQGRQPKEIDMTNAYSHIATYRANQAAIELQRATREAIPSVGGQQDDPLFVAATAAYDAACVALKATQTALDADPEYRAECRAAGDWLASLGA
jgi:hypothetical protein